MIVGAKKMNRLKSCAMKKTKKTGGFDQISNLPDSVLAHILSFVSTEEAIHTCILSKTWKSVWASTPVLEFDFGKFYRDRRVLNKTRKEKIKEYEVKYMEFIKGVMLNREALLLDKFKLHWFISKGYHAPESVTKFIPQALKFMPRVLSLHFHLNNCQNLDIDSIFTCVSLEEVVLSCKHDLVKFAPNAINLPSLKKLKLEGLNIGSDFLNKLFLGCPVLEELSMCNSVCYFDRISSNNLKKLEIHRCSKHWKVEKLEILTPGLLYLEITKSNVLETISTRNMPYLVNAMIDFGWEDNYSWINFGWEEKNVVTSSESNFLGCLSNATTLHVTLLECGIKEKLKNGASSCPTFNNLKSLSIVWKANFDFDLIAFFLRNSPNLKNITLFDQNFWKDTMPEEPKEDLSPREHLEMVTIVNYNLIQITSETLDLLLKNLYAHVRTIGKIIIQN